MNRSPTKHYHRTGMKQTIAIYHHPIHTVRTSSMFDDWALVYRRCILREEAKDTEPPGQVSWDTSTTAGHAPRSKKNKKRTAMTTHSHPIQTIRPKVACAAVPGACRMRQGLTQQLDPTHVVPCRSTLVK